jgi:archaellum biogenesis protein FlaJ (TadC family)
MPGFLQDPDGNKSSKRLCAILLISAAIVLAIFLCIIAIYHVIADKDMFIDIIKTFVYGGTGLGVGGNLAENMSDIVNNFKGGDKQ